MVPPGIPQLFTEYYERRLDKSSKELNVRVLLVYPDHPVTFWSLKHAVKFISKEANFPPLGLLTVAALLPEDWEKRLIDMNVQPLGDSDIEWADYVFVSAMSIQRQSAAKVIKRCARLGVTTVAGGPLFTSSWEDFEGVDHLLLGEAEDTLPAFLEDLRTGGAKRIYRPDGWADMGRSPIPLWGLVDMKKYASMNVQYSRGCPFNCEFCDITQLYGHKPRTKTGHQVLAELDGLHAHGWRGGVFFVDDNFIGNRRKLKAEMLSDLIAWQRERKYPFDFHAEASIDLADDEELMSMMVEAGFRAVFVGIESPNDMSLSECSKFQNRNRDMVESVAKIQSYGLQVQGGFIVGFDNDPPSIFDSQIDFIAKSGIVVAMVGLLNAPRGTRLYKRLQRENRLLKDMSGDNTDFTMNFIPKMDTTQLIEGYEKVVNAIYSPREYYERVRLFLRRYKPPRKSRPRLRFVHIRALLRSMWVLGMKREGRLYYWKLFFWSLTRRPKLFPLAVVFAIYGFHFREVLGT